MFSRSQLGLLLLALQSLVPCVVQAYPLVVEVEESTERCLHFNVPEDDDAHLVFIALPRFADESEETLTKAKNVEEYFVEQTLQLSKVRQKGSSLPKKYPNPPPDDTAAIMKEFLEMVDSNGGSQGKCCKIVIKNPDTGMTRIMESFYFTPIVLNHVRKSVHHKDEDEMDVPLLGGYSVCFNNEQRNIEAQIVMEAVMVNENPLADELESNAGFDPTAHLTPLTQQLSESVSAANSVLKEMRHMEKRETKMRITSDSISVRVRYFSYISVAVLLVVTYVQVSYLKRYFQKKKIL